GPDAWLVALRHAGIFPRLARLAQQLPPPPLAPPHKGEGNTPSVDVGQTEASPAGHARSAPSARERSERAGLLSSRFQTATKDTNSERAFDDSPYFLFAIACSPFLSSFLFSPHFPFPTRNLSFAAPDRGAGGAPVALGCLRGTRLGAL